MSSVLKHFVSGRSRRFIEDDFDLDLTYIKPNIIAMGFPSEKLEGVYRNQIKDVIRFLDIKHSDHYKVYNLCSERSYDPGHFHQRVSYYPFDEGNAPPFELIKPVCDDINIFLKEDDRNVAVIHCTDGKGRTGVIVCSYLLHDKLMDTAKDALQFYAEARTQNAKAVTIPSQRRYVQYYGHLVRNALDYLPTTKMLKALRFEGIPNMANGTCEPSFKVFLYKTKIYTSKVYGNIHRTDLMAELTLPQPIPLCGDIKFEFFHHSRFGGKEKMFTFWINTFFTDMHIMQQEATEHAVESETRLFRRRVGREVKRVGVTPNLASGPVISAVPDIPPDVKVVVLSKNELDKACEDSKHFPQNFQVHVVLEEVTSDSVEGFDELYSDSEDEENLSVTDAEEEWDISPQIVAEHAAEKKKTAEKKDITDLPRSDDNLSDTNQEYEPTHSKPMSVGETLHDKSSEPIISVHTVEMATKYGRPAAEFTSPSPNENELAEEKAKQRATAAENEAKAFCEALARAGMEVKEAQQAAHKAEKKADLAEGRAKAAETEAMNAQRREQEALARVEDCNKLVIEMQRQTTILQQRVADAETSTENAYQRAREAERRAQNAQDSEQQLWLVERGEVELMDRELGRGAWAVVKVAQFRGLPVAAKCLHTMIITPYNRRMFVREMNLAARVRHPNLVQFIGATLEGEPMILTELMSTSLRSVLEGGIRLTHLQMKHICLDVAQALNYLHLMKPHPVIHRDISSANVLLEPSSNDKWKAKVSDYGSANFMQLVKTVAPGCPAYAAPESLNPRLQSTKMDVFSFGVLLVELFTREFPDPDSLDAMVEQIQHPLLVQLVKQCREEDQQKRPAMSYILGQINML